MTQATKRFIGIALLLPAAPVFAQKPTAATSASMPASQADPNAIPGGDPSWRVADVAVALIIGLVVGYMIGAWRSAAKARASHA